MSTRNAQEIVALLRRNTETVIAAVLTNPDLFKDARFYVDDDAPVAIVGKYSISADDKRALAIANKGLGWKRRSRCYGAHGEMDWIAKFCGVEIVLESVDIPEPRRDVEFPVEFPESITPDEADRAAGFPFTGDAAAGGAR